MSKFAEDITQFNQIYKLPVNDVPTLNVGVPVIERLKAFKSILTEELSEIDEIVESVNGNAAPAVVLTMLADLLGDIQVYCASEMRKFGLPLDAVLATIMESNFSKLGADGKPIYDDRGKVQKGPRYWKPEPKIESMLTDLMVQAIAVAPAGAANELDEVEVNPEASKMLAFFKSKAAAEEIATEKRGFSYVDASVDLQYCARVMGVTEQHVVLSLGHSAAIVAISNLSRVPAKDEDVEIVFKGGKGVVADVHSKGIACGR